ncbi:hypothetical protein D1007_10052 [Hordeum vulgare]|nr:hypothetical protein D1007_10052 [Hordeum vulgare]
MLAQRPPPPTPSAAPHGHRWVLVRLMPALQMWMLELKVVSHVARRQARESAVVAEAITSSFRHRGGLPEPNSEKKFLVAVFRRSLSTTETDAHQLHWKKAKAPRLGIEHPECEAAEKAATATKCENQAT